MCAIERDVSLGINVVIYPADRGLTSGGGYRHKEKLNSDLAEECAGHDR
jgi:hypothetical protein